MHRDEPPANRQEQETFSSLGTVNEPFVNSDVIVVIPCKGRRSHLEAALPSVLEQRTDFTFAVLVVDYSCPDDTFAWCREQGHPRLCAVRVLDVRNRPFNASHARNIGACLAACESLVFQDADTIVPVGWLERFAGPVIEGRYDAISAGRGFRGSVSIDSRLFHEIRGFDEAFQGWGFEDRDLLQRSRSAGRFRRLRHTGLQRIPHDDTLRVRFYDVKNPRTSRRNNRRLAAARTGPVNPDGYGRVRRLQRWSPPDSVPDRSGS